MVRWQSGSLLNGLGRRVSLRIHGVHVVFDIARFFDLVAWETTVESGNDPPQPVFSPYSSLLVSFARLRLSTLVISRGLVIHLMEDASEELHQSILGAADSRFKERQCSSCSVSSDVYS